MARAPVLSLIGFIGTPRLVQAILEEELAKVGLDRKRADPEVPTPSPHPHPSGCMRTLRGIQLLPEPRWQSCLGMCACVSVCACVRAYLCGGGSWSAG